MAGHVADWIISRIKESGDNHTTIKFHGGEPTLNFDVIKYFVSRFNSYGKKYKFDYQLTTNAYELSDEEITFLSENINDLTVSIDGKPQNHNRCRKLPDGRGSFDNVLKNALLLKEKVTNLSIRLTIQAKSVEEFCDNVIYLIDYGFKRIVPVIDFWDLQWTPQKVDELERQCERLREYVTLYEFRDIKINYPINSILRKSICGGGISGYIIDPSGNLYPCMYTVGDRRLCCGNVFDGVNEERVNFFKYLYKCKIKACEGCTSYEYCPTVRCKFLNEKIMGSFLEPVPILCNLQNKIVEKNWSERQIREGVYF